MGLLRYMKEGLVEAGCDEAGRGCLCGPVACAAVILPPDFECEGLNDSKQLSERKRDMLRPVIEDGALAWNVVMVGAEEIDRINILKASIIGMHRALDGLRWRGIYPSEYDKEIISGEPAIPDHILVDGNKWIDYNGIYATTVVHGDAKYMSIAAASILAKTYRDAYMRRIAREYPGYGWERNKGYPTREHRQAIINLGLTPYHRRTYGPCQPSIFD